MWLVHRVICARLRSSVRSQNVNKVGLQYVIWICTRRFIQKLSQGNERLKNVNKLPLFILIPVLRLRDSVYTVLLWGSAGGSQEGRQWGEPQSRSRHTPALHRGWWGTTRDARHSHGWRQCTTTTTTTTVLTQFSTPVVRPSVGTVAVVVAVGTVGLYRFALRSITVHWVMFPGWRYARRERRAKCFVRMR